MSSKLVHIALAVALVSFASACSKKERDAKESGGGGGGGAGGAPANNNLYPQSDTPENLEGMLKLIVASASKGDVSTASTLTRGLLPNKASLAKALKDDVAKDFVDGMQKQYDGLPSDDAKVAQLLVPPPERTEVKVWGATTEEIAAYADDSIPYKEFPGGARRLAQSVLRPGVKFYEVEFLEPGKDAGMKYHMFYWDGGAWKMLGPAWRGLPQEN